MQFCCILRSERISEFLETKEVIRRPFLEYVGTLSEENSLLPNRECTVEEMKAMLAKLVKHVQVTGGQCYVSTDDTLFWFYYQASEAFEIVKLLARPDKEEWFHNPNGKKYLEEWHAQKLQAGVKYVFHSEGAEVSIALASVITADKNALEVQVDRWFCKAPHLLWSAWVGAT